MAKRTQTATRESATPATQAPVPDATQDAPPPSAQETMQAKLADDVAKGVVPEDATVEQLTSPSPATPPLVPQPEPSQQQPVPQDAQPPAPEEAEEPATDADGRVLAYLREQGFDATYESDEAALAGLLEANRRLAQRDELASYGERMLPYHDRLAQVIAAEQPAAAPQAQADETPSFWDAPPEYDPAWEQMVTTEKDDNDNTMYVPAGPHVPADVPQKYAAHQAYRQQVQDRIQSDFKGAVLEAVGPHIDSAVQERIQQTTAEQQAETEMRRVLDENEAAIFVAGTNRQQLTSFGETVNRGMYEEGASLKFAVEHAKMVHQQAAPAQPAPQAAAIPPAPPAASQMLASRQAPSPTTQVQPPPGMNVRETMRWLAQQQGIPLQDEQRPGLPEQ